MNAQLLAGQELLARIGQGVDLPTYLHSRGYKLTSDSPPDDQCIRMTAPTGHAVTLARSLNNRFWTYANPANPSDRGNIGDYLQRHESLTVAQAITRLSACTDPSRREVPEAIAYRAAIANTSELLERAKRQHETLAASRAGAVAALSRAGLNADSIDETRLGPIRSNFVGTIFCEPLAGELWASRYKHSDRTLVISERPIDALAFCQQRRDPHAACLAVGNLLDADQRKRLAHVLSAVPPGVKVVLATANTSRGRRLADEIQALAPMLRLDRQPPSLPGRWGEHLQLAKNHEAHLARRSIGLSR